MLLTVLRTFFHNGGDGWQCCLLFGVPLFSITIFASYQLGFLVVGLARGYLGVICSSGENGFPEEALLTHEECKDDAVFGWNELKE